MKKSKKIFCLRSIRH